MKIAVIGAGIAGITVARELSNNSDVTLFEKSRGSGGRMSVRRHGQWQFDHGAQFFTARSQEFQRLLLEPIEQGLVEEWTPKIVTLQPGNKPFKREWFEPHYVACPTMNALGKFLATDLDTRLQTQVAKILKHDSGWLLNDEQGQALGIYDFIVCAMPAPQCMELLPTEFAYYDSLKQVNYSPCFALMLGFSEPVRLNFGAAVVRDSPLAWIAVNSSRPGRDSELAIVAHSSNAWAAENLENPSEQLQAAMHKALVELLGEQVKTAAHAELHRWRYARVEQPLESAILLDARNSLAACGDWVCGNRVEDGFVSGMTLARALREL